MPRAHLLPLVTLRRPAQTLPEGGLLHPSDGPNDASIALLLPTSSHLPVSSPTSCLFLT